jgi:hypothetical protein
MKDLSPRIFDAPQATDSISFIWWAGRGSNAIPGIDNTQVIDSLNLSNRQKRQKSTDRHHSVTTDLDEMSQPVSPARRCSLRTSQTSQQLPRLRLYAGDEDTYSKLKR